MKKHQNIKNIMSVCALFFLTILVLYFSLKNDFSNIISEILSANLFLILIAFLFFMLYWLFKTIVIYNFAKKFNKEYRFRSAFRNQAITQFFNAVTPFSTGGQPFQIYSLTKNKLTISNATNVVIEDFVVYQISLVLLGIFAIILNHILNIFPYDGLLSKLVLLGFTINTIVIIVLFIVAFFKKSNKFLVTKGINILSFFKIVKDKEKTLEKWNVYINNFHEGAKILVANKKEFVLNILFSFLGLVCLYMVPVWILYSMGDFTSFNALESVIASAYVMLIGSFVPLPGGTGGIEYGFLKFFGVFIVNDAKLRALMLLWRFITFYMGIVIGGIALNIKERK